jgi:predicted N-formylglutamate amidohydrolase
MNRKAPAREALVLTCEHAGNRVPPRYARLFQEHEDLLASHRGWDPGALELARLMARRLAAPLVSTTVTRLLVEPNRSPHHPALFSRVSAGLDDNAKQRVLAAYYTPHRERVRELVRSHVDAGSRVVHVGVHTFTPELNGEVRRADVGLLYDPRRSRERALCAAWAAALNATHPGLRVRKNYPYRGAADGLTTSLRTEFPPDAYLGIELEVNQALAAAAEAPARRALAHAIVDTLRSALHPRA